MKFKVNSPAETPETHIATRNTLHTWHLRMADQNYNTVVCPKITWN